MDATRLTIQTLELIYNQFKSNAHQDLLDAQTFIGLIINNYQLYQMPDRWRTLSFNAISCIVSKFAQKPLANHYGQSSSEEHVAGGIGFVNWKKIFVLLALACSAIPKED